MIFSELYSAYYNAMAAILKEAVRAPVSPERLRAIVTETAFAESALYIEAAIGAKRWQLLTPEGETPLRHPPSMPLTTLQKRWLNAIAADPRIRLFPVRPPVFPGVEPLFYPEDMCVFDRYSDADPFSDPAYIARFRLILEAIRNRSPLYIETMARGPRVAKMVMLPERLEYSEKDDKFRLWGAGERYQSVVNLGRILTCRLYREDPARPFVPAPPEPAAQASVTFRVTDARNAPERVLLHFAHFEKEAQLLDDGAYLVKLRYDRRDETELVIRMLSFGPMLQVLGPEPFVKLLRERLKKQKKCDLS